MTAVEWLANIINNNSWNYMTIREQKKIIIQALEMEKQQIKQAQQVQKGDYCAVCGCREFWNDEEE